MNFIELLNELFYEGFLDADDTERLFLAVRILPCRIRCLDDLWLHQHMICLTNVVLQVLAHEVGQEST